MERRSVETIANALSHAGLRFLIAGGVALAFLSLADLLALKQRAGRPRDLEDIAGLNPLHPEPGRYDG